jgi:hypothetical protein
MSEALELVIKGSGAVVAYACSRCGRMSSMRDLAEMCCEPDICECGRTCKKPWTACDSCREEERQEKERKKFEEAEKIPWERYEGPVYFDDEHYSDVEEMADCLACADIELPEYVWACTKSRLSLNADDIIYNELEAQEFHEGAFDQVVNIKELQAAMDEWLKQQDLESWFVDETRAILLEGLQDE